MAIKKYLTVGIGMAFDTPFKGRQIVGMAVTLGGGRHLAINIAPQSPGGFNPWDKMWAETPEAKAEWEALQRDQVPLADAAKQLTAWLHSLKGTLVGVSGYGDFYRMTEVLLAHTGKNPFGGRMLDAASFVAGQQGDASGQKKWPTRSLYKGGAFSRLPLEVAEKGLFAVCQGQALRIEKEKVRAEKKASPSAASTISTPIFGGPATAAATGSAVRWSFR